MKVMTKFLAGTLATAFCAFAAGCGSGGDPGASGDLDKLTITYFPGIASGVPLLAAEQSGAFERHGLDVDLLTVKTGPDASSSVVGGHADLMVQDHSNAFLLLANGHQPVVVVGNEATAVNGVIARNGFEIPDDVTEYPASIAALKGADFGVVVRGGALENIATAILRDAGLDPSKDVTFSAVGLAPTAVPALEQGEVDAYLGQEPMMTRAIEEGWGTILVDLRQGEGPDGMNPWQSTGLVALRDWADKNVDAVHKLQEAMRDAHTWMQDSANRAALKEIVAKQMGIEGELAGKVIDNNLFTWGPDVDPEAIQNVANFALASGLVKSDVDVDAYIFDGATGK